MRFYPKGERNLILLLNSLLNLLLLRVMAINNQVIDESTKERQQNASFYSAKVNLELAELKYRAALVKRLKSPYFLPSSRLTV